jgi:pyrimidine deaminase RibD-like protein
MILTDLFESREIHNQDRLDQVLARCIEMVHEKNQANPKKYGKVAACIIDMKNRKVFGINSPGADGRRRHAERMAIDAYHKRYGKILPGAIIVTTLSPCNRDMVERDGASCQDLLLQVGIEKVYSGYMDPSQHSDHPFTEETTQNDDLWRQCKEFSDSFVHDDLTESHHHVIDAATVLDYVKQAHAPEAFDIEYSITDHPEWELKTIPLSQLNLDPDGEAQDPYNRVNWVDDDKVQELIPRIGSVLKSLPIVVDSQGWIIDGNHRAVAAAEAGLTSVPAYVPVKPVVAENFADGRNPGRKGLAKRSGVNTKASVTSLRNTAKHSTGEKQRMAHWLANMKAGRAKARKK